jgi:small subunit ribosomal protein S18
MRGRPGNTARRGAPSNVKPRRGKPKVCVFCTEHAVWVDYKDVNLLRRFISDRGKIRSRSNTGNCAQHQRAVATAIKTARELALLPYAVRVSASDRPGGRGRGGGARGNGPRPAGRDAAVVGPDEDGRRGDDDQAETNVREDAEGAGQAGEGEGEA